MQSRKYWRFKSDVHFFGPLTKQVKFVPLVFEASGGLGPTAAEEFAAWSKEAAELVRKQGGRNYRALGEPHTWNALKFANLYSQMLSFSIVRVTALSLVKASEALARGHGGAAIET